MKGKKDSMKRNNRKVPTRFGPAFRFDIKATPPPPLRDRQEGQLEPLKQKLLAERLDRVPSAAFKAELERAAGEAAALAWVTAYPALVFPLLFAEKVDEAKTRYARQRDVRQRSRALLAV